MTIVANGKPLAAQNGESLDALLQRLGLAPDRVVVEHNGRALHRERFATTVLTEGDRLEIAQMVGGG